MKHLLMTLGLLMTFLMPIQAQAEMGKPALYAISFHADWCGSCKMIGPQMIKARGKADLDNKDILFVKLDLTDGAKRHQSGLMAQALGIGDFYKDNNGKTGFVLLVDAKSGEMVGKITKEHDANAIISTLNDKISAM